MTEGKKYAFIESRAYTIKAFDTGIRPEKKTLMKVTTALTGLSYFCLSTAAVTVISLSHVLGAPKPKSRVFCIGDTQTTESITYHRLERVK